MAQANHQIPPARRAPPKRSSIEHRLGNYFDRGAPRGSGGSSYGVMCERAALYEHASVECKVCQGSGIRVLSAEEMAYRSATLVRETDPAKRAEIRRQLSLDSNCKACRGSGWVTPKRAQKQFDRHAVTTRCWRCRGTAEIFNEELQDVCPRCEGDGYTIPVTVFSVGSSKKGRLPQGSTDASGGDGKATPAPPTTAAGDTLTEAGEWVDEDALREAGRMDRLAATVRRKDPLLADTLAAYLGPAGNTWGPTRWGRIHAVWPLTKPGRILAELSARESVKGHSFLLPADQLLAAEREADARTTVPNFRRRTLIKQADEAARHLLARAMRELKVSMRELGL